MTPTFRIRAVCYALAVAGLVSAAAPATGQAPNLTAVVGTFYPEELVELASSAGRPLVREQCFAVLESDRAGNARVIVAAYTNLISGAVRVLAAGDSGFSVVAEPGGEDHAGWHCEVRRIDVDLDGRYEAHVKFTANQGSEDWIYRWDGQQLFNLTPVNAGLGGILETNLINASVFDIDADGVLEVFTFSQTRGDDPPLPAELYRLANGRFVLDRPVVGAYRFERSKGTPETYVITVFTPRGAQGPFTLRVFNGTHTTKRPVNVVESGRVWLNGQELVSPNDFGKRDPAIERVVNLQADNELKVELAGAPGGQITIVIDAASWAP